MHLFSIYSLFILYLFTIYYNPPERFLFYIFCFICLYIYLKHLDVLNMYVYFFGGLTFHTIEM